MSENNTNQDKIREMIKKAVNRKIVRIEGPDWFHDPSGEELEIIYEDEDNPQDDI